MEDKDINDIRTYKDFRNISFSEFQKIKVKIELIKNTNDDLVSGPININIWTGGDGRKPTPNWLNTFS